MPRTIEVKVTPRARKNFVKESGGILKVYTTCPALEGRANEAVIQALAEYFSLKKNQIAILRGFTSRSKVVQIMD